MRFVFFCLSITLMVTKVHGATIPLDSCEYYYELDAKLNCGPQGYFQRFAIPYCEDFLSQKDRFSPRGQVILRNIRLCLQEVLSVKADVMNCTEIEAYGISSHEYCYLQAGFCKLGTADRLKVFWVVRSEILNSHVWELAANVQRQCLKAGGPTPASAIKAENPFLAY